MKSEEKIIQMNIWCFGDSQVAGNILLRFNDNYYKDYLLMPEEELRRIRTIELDREIFKLDMTVRNGQHRFNMLPKNKKPDCILLGAEGDNPKSIEEIKSQFEKLKEFYKDDFNKFLQEQTIKILIDYKDLSQVSKEKFENDIRNLQELVKEYNLTVTPVSLRTGKGLEEAVISTVQNAKTKLNNIKKTREDIAKKNQYEEELIKNTEEKIVKKISKRVDELDKGLKTLNKLKDNKVIGKIFKKSIKNSIELKEHKKEGLQSLKTKVENEKPLKVQSQKPFGNEMAHLITDIKAEFSEINKGTRSKTKKVLKKLSKNYAKSNKRQRSR